VPVRSKIGAGDSLIGGFLSGLESGLKFEQAACLGVAASASAVMREAPRLCLRSDLPGLLKRITVRQF
jgi:6-phosphofructokinase 2